MAKLKKFDFHYTPTGTGVISGPDVLQQTEDAINEIGEYADNASDNSEEALNIAKEARETAQHLQMHWQRRMRPMRKLRH